VEKGSCRFLNAPIESNTFPVAGIFIEHPTDYKQKENEINK